MCGISGIWHFQSPDTVRPEEVLRMNESIRYRGPDHSDLYLSPDRKLALGHNRLSIIDLSAEANQPLSDHEGALRLVFNGEIYNYQEIRKTLSDRGHPFNSHSDSEVILNGYREWGVDVIPKLDGMWAFALWDSRKRSLLLSRDRIGIKPLYFAVEKGAFCFSSETKALLTWDRISREVDYAGVVNALAFQVPACPNTLFKNIKKLPPASFMEIDEGGAKEIRTFWSPLDKAESYRGALARMSEADAAVYCRETAHRLLNRSVRKRLVADVPVGAYLSGGIDSGVVTGIASRLVDYRVTTLTIGFERNVNEFDEARATAEHCGSNHEEILIPVSRFREAVEDWTTENSDGYLDLAGMTHFFLSRRARELGLKTLLIGEGSDEIFAGYWPDVLQAFDYEHLRNGSGFEAALRSAVSGSDFLCRVMNRLNLSFLKEITFDHRGGNYFQPHLIRYSPRAVGRMVNGPAPDLRTSRLSSLSGMDGRAEASGLEFLGRMALIYVRGLIPDYILYRADRFSMRHGVELRVPYLDHELVEFAIHIPAKFKIKAGEDPSIQKRLLRDIGRDYLPAELVERRKTGFGAPKLGILLQDLNRSGDLKEVLSASKFLREGVFKRKVIRDIAQNLETRVATMPKLVWSLYCLAMWHRRWVERS